MLNSKFCEVHEIGSTCADNLIVQHSPFLNNVNEKKRFFQ